MQQCRNCPAPSSGRVPVCTWKCEADRLMGPRADITLEDKALFLAYACSELPHDSLQRYPSPSHRGNLSFRNPRWHLIQRGRRKTRSPARVWEIKVLSAKPKVRTSFMLWCVWFVTLESATVYLWVITVYPPEEKTCYNVTDWRNVHFNNALLSKHAPPHSPHQLSYAQAVLKWKSSAPTIQERSPVLQSP